MHVAAFIGKLQNLKPSYLSTCKWAISPLILSDQVTFREYPDIYVTSDTICRQVVMYIVTLLNNLNKLVCAKLHLSYCTMIIGTFVNSYYFNTMIFSNYYCSTLIRMYTISFFPLSSRCTNKLERSRTTSVLLWLCIRKCIIQKKHFSDNILCLTGQ